MAHGLRAPFAGGLYKNVAGYLTFFIQRSDDVWRGLENGAYDFGVTEISLQIEYRCDEIG